MVRDGGGLPLRSTAGFCPQSCGCVPGGHTDQKETLLKDVDGRG